MVRIFVECRQNFTILVFVNIILRQLLQKIYSPKVLFVSDHFTVEFDDL